MDGKALAEYIDNQRWLMNNGLLNDAIKNQLFMYGTIVHKEVQAVEVEIDVTTKTISYQVYVPTALLKKRNKWKELSTSQSFFGLWKFKRFLKKEGNLNFEGMLTRFVKDFCGPKWGVKVEIVDAEKYIESVEERKDNEVPVLGDTTPNQQSDG